MGVDECAYSCLVGVRPSILSQARVSCDQARQSLQGQRAGCGWSACDARSGGDEGIRGGDGELEGGSARDPYATAI